MRIAPLILLVVIVAVLGATVGTVFVWIVAAVSLLALGVLFFFMVRQGQFVGPRVLVDDAKERLDAMGKDEDETVVIVQRKDSIDG